jgi:rfaE bifunctional protein kinase chain/domain
MTNLHTLIDSFGGMRVIVVGDIILDEYLIGNATRMSREAPIPVLEYAERRVIPGGAANPAANIVSLGGIALMVGVVGADAEAVTLRQTLERARIDTNSLIEDRARPTTVKTRIMAQMGLRFPQQVARLDKLSRQPIHGAVQDQVCEQVHLRTVRGSYADALLFSDYGGGLITPMVLEAARTQADADSVLLAADAQSYIDKYAGFGVVKCNADDARAFTGRDLRTADDYAAAAVEMAHTLALKIGMVITRGGGGATYGTSDGTSGHLPAVGVSDVFDTVGAGDTHIAVMTLALLAGGSLPDAIRLANAASSIVVKHVGNYTPTRDEVKGTIT